MAVMTLESLVLRGVFVLVGEKRVNLRLGTSVLANEQASEIPVSIMRHSMPDYRQDQPAPWSEQQTTRVGGTGRSPGHAGVLGCRSGAGIAGGHRSADAAKARLQLLAAGAFVSVDTASSRAAVGRTALEAASKPTKRLSRTAWTRGKSGL